MKKIMFNDRYGLTQAVLEGRKTQIRLIIKLSHVRVPGGFKKPTKRDLDTIVGCMHDMGLTYCAELRAPYAIGEEVAIAQPYDEVWDFVISKGKDTYLMLCANICIGAKNKFWVKAGLMPNHIRFTNLRIERLKDISDDDCLKEGIYADHNPPVPLYNPTAYSYDADPIHNKQRLWFNSPRDAFASMIDKVCGRGTWKSNPYVFVFDFELVK